MTYIPCLPAPEALQRFISIACLCYAGSGGAWTDQHGAWLKLAGCRLQCTSSWKPARGVVDRSLSGAEQEARYRKKRRTNGRPEGRWAGSQGDVCRTQGRLGRDRASVAQARSSSRRESIKATSG
ncbi:hypothetical protein P280DRAFT_242821 [Massarina eburnea CBS 473.64]|uniref:Uncharacterized protein n=1 Tax=Massarina eburnea CBS 473.64 TaxID=1395130 RepID=A0A6A6S585_9PLEO|nr:hypothetical protein P280DRAFT_242821 [Massarina eburnea CBS 473.64]